MQSKYINEKNSCRIFCVGSGMNVRQTVKRIIGLPHISAIIRCVRLACQPTSQQYCSLILNQHQPPATRQSTVLFSHNKSISAINHNQTNTAKIQELELQRTRSSSRPKHCSDHTHMNSIAIELVCPSVHAWA